MSERIRYQCIIVIFYVLRCLVVISFYFFIFSEKLVKHLPNNPKKLHHQHDNKCLWSKKKLHGLEFVSNVLNFCFDGDINEWSIIINTSNVLRCHVIFHMQWHFLKTRYIFVCFCSDISLAYHNCIVNIFNKTIYWLVEIYITIIKIVSTYFLLLKVHVIYPYFPY